MTLRMLGASALALLLAGCASTGRVTSIAEPGFTPGPAPTYAWQPVEPRARAELDPRVDNAIVRGQIEQGIAKALAARGFTAAPAASARWLVSFRVGVVNQTETRTDVEPAPIPPTRILCGIRGCIPVAMDWGWYGPPVVSTRTVEYLEGGVMVDLVDRETGKLAWRSTFADKVYAPKPASQEEIDRAMAALVAEMPQ